MDFLPVRTYITKKIQLLSFNVYSYVILPKQAYAVLSGNLLFFYLLRPALLLRAFTVFKLKENLWEVIRVSAACLNIQPLTMGHMW